MRKTLIVSAFLFVALCAMPVFGQATGSILPTSYGFGTFVVDQHGNLIVFDTLYTLTPVTVPAPGGTGSSASAGPNGTVKVTPPILTPIRQTMTPKTRITVIPGGTGQPASQEYSAVFQIVGAGKWGVYAVAQSYSATGTTFTYGPRKLVAINPAVLPTDISGFINTDLTARGEVRLEASTTSDPDVLFCVDPPNMYPILGPIPASATAPTVLRIARRITFDGTRFDSKDVNLQQ